MERTDINTTIGRNIKYRRLLRGLPQKAVGNHLGITAQQIQKYEAGVNALSSEKLLQLADLFDCSVNDLYGDAIDHTATYALVHPWNPHKVHTLVSHFNRIRSHTVRHKVCGMVRMIADIVSGETKEML